MTTVAGTPRVSRRAHQSSSKAAESPLQAAAVAAADTICLGCLYVIIFVVPLFMAGVRETGTAVFVGCSLLMSVCWAISHLLKPQATSAFTIAIPLGFAAVALVGLQLIPLPRPVVETLSPFSSQFFPAWNASHESLPQHGYWDKISLTPSLTLSGFVLLVAYVSFFFTLSQRIKNLADVDSILQLLAMSTVVMAVIGLGQLFFGNGDFLWMFHHPFRDASWPAKGTFTNQNHFAHFLALGIGPLVWAWKKSGPIDGNNIKGKVANRGFGVSRSTASYQQAVGGAIAIVVFSGVLSFSRGGIASILIACVFSVAAIGRQWVGVVRLAVPTVAFMTIGVLLFGTELLESKWQRLAEAESLEDLCRGRAWLWSALLTAVPSFWPAGSGVGSHAEVYPTWMQQDIGKRLSHAESGYFQVLIETGVPGLLLALSAIGLCAFWFFSNWKKSDVENRARLLVLASGLTVSTLHSVVDFVWYIPACLIFALTLAACLCRVHQMHSLNDKVNRPGKTSPTWAVAWALIVGLLAIPVGRLTAEVTLRDANSEASWMSYREQAVALGNGRNYGSLDAVDERLELMITHLEECVRIDPTDCRAMSELSALYVRRFEKHQRTSGNPMTVQEVKNTVESTEFESPVEILRWLRRAFGDDSADLYRAYASARNAIKGQPLRGECYLVLAQLEFLRTSGPQDPKTLIDQAVLLRPYMAPILYFAGMSEAEKGNIDGACEWWKKAFHVSRELQPLIIRTLASHLPPAEIVDRIDADANGLWLLFNEYGTLNSPEHAKWVADRYNDDFQLMEEQVADADRTFWTRSSDLFMASQRTEKAIYCLGKAVQQMPLDYRLRKRYGLALASSPAKDDAIRELEWCLLRNPDDGEITQVLAAVRQAANQGGGL